jgi:hypothetical protein
MSRLCSSADLNTQLVAQVNVARTRFKEPSRWLVFLTIYSVDYEPLTWFFSGLAFQLLL